MFTDFFALYITTARTAGNRQEWRNYVTVYISSVYLRNGHPSQH